MEVNDQVMNGGEEVKISENNLAVDNNNEPEPVNESNDMENDLDSDDLSQEDETNKFLSLMSKAERKNQRKLRNIQKQSANSSHTWRDAMLSDPEDDTEDTDDEDDPDETRKFLSMMQAKKKNMVKIRWVNGKVEVTPISEDDNSQTSGDSSSFPDTLTVTRMAPGETQASSSRKTLPDSVTITRVPAPSHPVFQQFQPVATAPVQQLDCVKLQKQDIERRRAEARENLSSSSARDNKGGKRKFEDRMTLTEAKATDFQDSRDYVDFLQSKLQGVNIKIVK